MSKPKDVERLKTKMAERGFIYFAQHGNAVKIGKTVKISKRMSELLNANPFVKLIAVIEVDGVGLAEKAAHTLLSRKRSFREWFLLEPGDIELVVETLKERDFNIVKFEQFPSEPTINADENIKMILGENESLKQENKLLREIINELQKAIDFSHLSQR